ncbi:MAG: ABC transporter permease [Caldilineaceae bacterium]|nr:ABC transporter permease [Caldilineaceae bacterium]
MAFGKLWVIAFRDLGRNRRRTAFTLIAVALGLALLILLNGYLAGVTEESLQNSIRLRTGHVQLRAASYEEKKVSLQWRDLLDNVEERTAQASAQPEVKAAAPVLWATGIVNTADDSAGLQVIGIDTSSPIYDPVRESVIAGAFLTADDRSGILIGQRLADNLNLNAGDNVSLTLINADGEPEEGIFTVRGLFSTGIVSYDANTLFMPLAKAQAFAGTGDRASAILMLLHGQEDADAVAASLQVPGTIALTWNELNQLFLQTLETGMSFYLLLDAIVMLVVAVVIANTLLMAVFERIREMGILAALGMKARQIMLMFLLEAATIGVLGSILGIVLGLAGVAYLVYVGIYIGDLGATAQNVALGDTLHGRFVPVTFAWLTLWTLVVILVASLYPAWFAARREPVEALHSS